MSVINRQLSYLSFHRASKNLIESRHIDEGNILTRSFKVSTEYLEDVRRSVTNSGFNTQQDVANHLSIALSTVSRFLNGGTVSCEIFRKLCKLLTLDCDQIRCSIKEGSPKAEELSKILIFDYSFQKKSDFASPISSALSQVQKADIWIELEQTWDSSNLNNVESLLFLVSSHSESVAQEIHDAISEIKKAQRYLGDSTFSILIVHIQSLMSLPLNHELHQKLQGIDQFEWHSSEDMAALMQKIMDINMATKQLSNLKSFLPSLAQLEISKEWQLTYIGENQLKKLGALVADLKNTNERQIRSGYSYWGLGPAYMWERACTDRVGYHMHDNISNFPKTAQSLSHFVDPEQYNFVSLGVGEGSKDKVLISDFFCSEGRSVPRDDFLYVPVDMSLDMLRISAEKTQDILLYHRCIGIQRDIESSGSMAEIAQVAKLMGDHQPILYSFLGNTIANVENPEEVLKSIAEVMEPDDLLLFEVQTITELALGNQNAYETVRREYLSGAFRRFVESALLQNTDLRINPGEMNNSYRVDVSLYNWEPYGSSLLIDCFFENNTSQPLHIKLINGDDISIGIQENIRLLRSRKLPPRTLYNFVKASGFKVLGENSFLNPSEGTGFGVMMLKRAEVILDSDTQS